MPQQSKVCIEIIEKHRYEEDTLVKKASKAYCDSTLRFAIK